MSAEEELREIAPDDPAYPPNVLSPASRLHVREYTEYGDDTRFWGFGPIPHGASIYGRDDGGYELKVYQDEEAYERNHAPAFRLRADRLHLSGAFIDGIGGRMGLPRLARLGLRYTDKYGYTAYLRLPDE